jgi:hypothetical protein
MKKKNRILAIHQPNYFPWLGYFFKIYASDIFVLLDDVQFAKEGLTKRTFIRKEIGQSEKKYLTIPVKKASLDTSIVDIKIDHSKNWSSVHLANLKQTYCNAPYFNEYYPLIINILENAKAFHNLSDLNIHCLFEMTKLLNLTINFHKSSNLPVNGKKFLYIENLIEYLNADVYLSGMGAKSYNQIEYFERAEKRLIYNAFFPYLQDIKYPQKEGEFLNGLSILDALFNIGATGINELFSAYKKQHKL